MMSRVRGADPERANALENSANASPELFRILIGASKSCRSFFLAFRNPCLGEVEALHGEPLLAFTHGVFDDF